MGNEIKIDRLSFPGSAGQAGTMDQLYHTGQIFLNDSPSTIVTITSGLFDPVLPAGVTKIPLLIVRLAYHSWSQGVANSGIWHQFTSTPFNGTNPAKGIYRDIEINDQIQLKSYGTDTFPAMSATGRWMFLAILRDEQ